MCASALPSSFVCGAHTGLSLDKVGAHRVSLLLTTAPAPRKDIYVHTVTPWVYVHSSPPGSTSTRHPLGAGQASVERAHMHPIVCMRGWLLHQRAWNSRSAELLRQPLDWVRLWLRS